MEKFRFDSLMSDFSHLKKKHERYNTQYEICLKRYNEIFAEYIGKECLDSENLKESGYDPESMNIVSQDDKINVEGQTDLLKKLYRKMSTRVHPDKVEQDPELRERKEELSELFKEINEAYENGNLGELINLAQENPLFDGKLVGEVKPTDEDLDLLEKSLEKYSSAIDKIQGSGAWIYFFGTKEDREALLDFQKRLWKTNDISWPKEK